MRTCELARELKRTATVIHGGPGAPAFKLARAFMRRTLWVKVKLRGTKTPGTDTKLETACQHRSVFRPVSLQSALLNASPKTPNAKHELQTLGRARIKRETTLASDNSATLLPRHSHPLAAPRYVIAALVVARSRYLGDDDVFRTKRNSHLRERRPRGTV
jgi:hypothetical protein